MSDSTSGLDVAIRGASAQSWRSANPRELLKTIVDDNPGSDRISLYNLFRKRLEEDDARDFIDTIIEYWFANNYQSIVTASTRTSYQPISVTSSSQRTSDMVLSVKTRLEQKIEERVKIKMMLMLMPNGKRLKDCTGAECTQLSASLGKWLGLIGKMVGDDKIVGAAMSEADLRAAYAAVALG